MRLRPHLVSAAALLTAACSSGMTQSPATKPGASSADGAAPKPTSPARYVLTQSQGAIFDEATKGVAVPRPELAIVMGRRAKLDGGTLVAVAPSPEGVVGFRSLPDRLGGGYLVWTDLRTYHTKDFLGALTPVADIGPTAGARPWFRTILLRTDRGTFELDLASHSVKRWRPHPGVLEATAIDDKRGVTLDVMGRVRSTVDGGLTWVDATASLGVVANATRLNKKGELELISLAGNADLRLTLDSKGIEPIPPSTSPYYGRRYNPYSPYQYNYSSAYPPPPEPEGIEPISQSLASDALTAAAVAGLLLDANRALVGRENGGMAVLSTRTGGEITTGTLLGVLPEYAGCQPLRSGETILLACTHTTGADVLVLDGPLNAPKLEATFPDVGSFVSDERGHLAFTGRCGRTPPSPDDFGARPAPRRAYDEDDMGGGYGPYGGGYGPYGGGYDPEYTPPDEVPEKDKGAPDEKRVCVRLEGGHWIEHHLTGDDAKDLYRWVLGDDGEVTALLLKGANPDEPDKENEGDGDHGDEDDDAPMRRHKSDRTPARGAPRDRTALAQPAPPPPPPPLGTGGPSAGPRPPKASKPATSASPSAKPPGSSSPSAKPPGSAKPTASAAPSAKKPAPPKPVPAKDGVRIVRLDPKDRVLKKGKWTRTPVPQTQAPWRSIDRSFWLEADGTLRGWMHLGEETTGSSGHDSGMDSEGGEPEIVTAETTGRFAGVRITPQGKATILSLPAHVQSVLFGGPYGLARAEGDDRNTYFETTDGGATWTEVEGPPVGDLEDGYDDSRFPGCSAIGCALSSGLARIGWGSPKPTPPKKEKDAPSSGADPFPVPRLPKLDCTFEGEPETFPAAAPKPKPKTEPVATGPKKPAPSVPGLSEDMISSLPPDLQEMLRASGGSIPPGLEGLLPPGLLPTASPVAPPPPAKPIGSAKPKAAKPPPPPKPPPAPPAEIVSLRTKPQSNLGQLKDKNWVGDVVIPFDPTAAVKHISTSANTLEKLQGSVFPVLGDRGVDLLLAWDKRRALIGSAAPALLPFDYNGRFDAAVAVPAIASKSPGSASSIVAYDDSRHVLALLQPDASRAFLRLARIPDPTRGKLTIARRLDAPGAALIWYSPYSSDVYAGAIDFARAEVGPLVALGSTATLMDGALPQCTAKTPASDGIPGRTNAPSSPNAGLTYQFLVDLSIPVTVLAHSGKSLFSEMNVPTTLLVRATPERLCVVGAEVRGSGRPIDLTAVFGPKSAAVARSRASAEDPTKLTLDKLSCLLHGEESK